MTKKEKATRRYIFAELRMNPLIREVRVIRSGHRKAHIVFYLYVDADQKFQQALGIPGPIFTSGIIGADEVEELFVRMPRSAIRQILYTKIWDAFLGYEEFLVQKLNECRGIDPWEAECKPGTPVTVLGREGKIVGKDTLVGDLFVIQFEDATTRRLDRRLFKIITADNPERPT